jgi:hypothetical protein
MAASLSTGCHEGFETRHMSALRQALKYISSWETGQFAWCILVSFAQGHLSSNNPAWDGVMMSTGLECPLSDRLIDVRSVDSRYIVASEFKCPLSMFPVILAVLYMASMVKIVKRQINPQSRKFC